MNIIGFMRVKNEARWIRESVESLLPLADRVYILDDHSTDGTPEICEALPRVTVIRSTFHGIDEARDKTFLVGYVWDRLTAEERADSWGFFLDGDELLERGGAKKVRASLASGAAQSYRFRFIYFWNSRDQIRTDGVYNHMWRQSAWKLGPNQRFMQTRFGGNFHCGSVPEPFVRRAAQCPARILHLGYMLKEDRLRKFAWYSKIDPNNMVEDGYRHMVQGDIPEIPASARLKHAGPLKLEVFNV